MPLWKLWRKERETRRRLRQMQAGVRECLEDRTRLPEVCRELGVAPEAMEQWLRAVHGEPPAPATPPLQTESLPEDALREEMQDGEPSRRKEAADAFAERVRRLLVLVLELPLTRLKPEMASDFVVQVADVAAPRDVEELGQLEVALDWLTRFAPHEAVKRGEEIPERGRAVGEAVRLAGSSDIATFVEHPRRPWLLKTIAKSYYDVLMRHTQHTSILLREIRQSFLVSALEIRVLFERGRARLDIRAGDPAQQTVSRHLDSQRTAGSGNRTQAEADLLVVTRPRFRRLHFDLDDASGLSAEAVRQAAQSTGEQLPDLFWNVEEGPGLWASSDPGDPFPVEVDVAWSQPEPAAINMKEPAFRSLVKAEDAPIVASYNDDTAVLVDDIAESRFEEDTPALFETLGEILGASAALAQPDLAVQLAVAVCRHRGTLGWETCLSLANSRARFHRYVENGENTRWRVQVGVRPGTDGTVEIPFAVVEQPLSSRFRHRFEAADLAGRVRILWELVDYASQLHTSLLALTADQAERQVA